jgi:membrane-associated phospholipid phosphatase
VRTEGLLSALAVLLLTGACATVPAVRTAAPAVLDLAPPTASEFQATKGPPFEPSEPDVAGATGEPGITGHLPGFATLLINDTKAIATAPFHWGRSDWMKLGIGVLVVGGAALLDEELRHSVERGSTGNTRGIARTVARFGGEYSWGVLGAFFLSGKLLKDDKAKAVAEDGLASCAIASGVITPILKLTVGRRRPSETEGTFAFGGQGVSFPSGHATQAFAIASVVASHYPSPWVKVAAYGLAGVVGLARIEQGVHYGSDVLAGALIGIVVGKAVVRLHESQRFHISAVPSVNPASPGAALAIRMDLDDVTSFFRDD